MKNLLTLTLLIFGLITGRAQTYIPMVEDSMIVVNEVNGFAHPHPIVYKYLGDTMISGNSYFKCYQDSVLTDSSYAVTAHMRYHGAIREANKKVYFVRKDSVTEKKIYDFEMNLTDTSLFYYTDLQNDAYFDTRYARQETLLIQGVTRRMYYYDVFGLPINVNVVAEGFGNTVYSSNEIETDNPTRRACVIKKNNPNQNLPSSYSVCYQNILANFVSLPINETLATVKLYPNPAQNKLSITAQSPIFSCQIMDMQGEIIDQRQVNSTLVNIELGLLKKGMYLVKITTLNGENTTKKFIKE